MTFHELLRSLREAQEMSQQDFARRMEVSPQYQCDLENGRRLPSVKYVERLCKKNGRGPKGANVWHALGARAHGWKCPSIVARISGSRRARSAASSNDCGASSGGAEAIRRCGS